MKLLMLMFLFIIFAVNQTFAVKITSNGLQRATKGEECTFRWTVDEPITSYVIYNRTSGHSTTLRQNSYHDYDSSSGVITLVLNNVQLTDAGNYSLEIIKGSNTVIDSTACLFVYGSLEGNLALTFGSNPPTEGDTVELTCNLTSESMPVANGPEIRYTWTLSSEEYDYLHSRTVVLSMEDVIDGYTLKNNGRTLRISSVRHPDDQYVSCYGLEEGSNPKQLPENREKCRLLYYYLLWDEFICEQCFADALARCYNYGTRLNLDLSMRLSGRPYVNFYPSSKKFNAVVGQPVELSFYIYANPSNTSTTNWTFVNSAGILQNLPPQSTAGSRSIRFNLTSTAYYGYYSISVNNKIGSETVTFHVLPQGPPDAPSKVRLKHVSHCEIAIQYNLMHSNSGKHSQRIYFSLKLSEGRSTTESSSVMYQSESFNSTHSYIFTKNILPETSYKVSVWSVNGFGSSEVVEFEVRTRKQPKLQVSPETISIEGTRAIIDFTVELGGEEVVRVEAKCCSLLSGQYSNYSGRYKGNQVVVNSIPDGTVYFIDLIIYSGIHYKYYYYSDAVRGVRVSRSRNEERISDSPLTAAVLVLMVLGTISFALNAVLIIYLLIRRRRSRQSDKPLQDQLNTGTRDTADEMQQPDEDNTYEAMEMASSNENHYYEAIKKGRRQQIH